VLGDKGRPIIPCVYDAAYYKAGHLVIDTLADTAEAGQAASAPDGGFREKLIYMQKDGRMEVFTPNGKRVRGE